VSALADLVLDYRVAFLRYLSQRSEAALTVGYELGRRAVDDGISVLDVSQVHHQLLVEVLEGTPAQDVPDVVVAGSEFLVEVLSTFDLAHRRLRGGA